MDQLWVFGSTSNFTSSSSALSSLASAALNGFNISSSSPSLLDDLVVDSSSSNTGTTDTDDDDDDLMEPFDMATHRMLSSVSEVFFLLICVVGLCGNSLVIYVVLRYSKMQTVTNLYILNLAVADECFLIGLPFLFVTSYLRHWPFGFITCKVFMTTTGINQFTSSAFLTVMSADRYVAICHAVKGRSIRTPVVSRVVAFTTWMVSAVLMAPLFMYSSTRVTNNETGTTTCSVFLPDDDQGNTYPMIFTLYNFSASFVIPLVLIIIFYSQVILTLRNTKSRRKKTRKKVTRLVLTVIIAYMLCWLPYWFGQVLLLVRLLDLFPVPVTHMTLVNYNIVASIPMYCNSAINPILYAFLRRSEESEADDDGGGYQQQRRPEAAAIDMVELRTTRLTTTTTHAVVVGTNSPVSILL
ncbi:unnamed protein product [Notodromas monacha]|uniref:G-protein coupled receptors family 1 profile domain-containing protein n=1 Tax=Notodromas monacha TaxID=399045 RepID=A0A7R9GGK5_9CRUS|nr:unnamed protein product [Notodromas monacha]CAG0920022.1 unnamed protein product [Notodromas monacha]